MYYFTILGIIQSTQAHLYLLNVKVRQTDSPAKYRAPVRPESPETVLTTFSLKLFRPT
jgi:hypothetical protein